MVFYRGKATGGKVPCISGPGFGYAGLPEPTTALIKPQMRIVYCRFFLKGWLFNEVSPSNGYPYFQNPRRDRYNPDGGADLVYAIFFAFSSVKLGL